MKANLLLVIFAVLSWASPGQPRAQNAPAPGPQTTKEVCAQTDPLRDCGAGDMGGLLHASSTQVLSTTPSRMGRVIRDGFAKAGDAPPLLYVASDAACSLNAGKGDSGSQVPTSDGKCWIANFGAFGADVRHWGVVMDGITSADVALSNALAWAKANQGMLVAPGGKIAVTGARTVAFDRASLTCAGGPVDGNTTRDSYGNQGTTFLLTSRTVQPFTLGKGVRIRDCNYYWPDQNGNTQEPISYPPLFTEPKGEQMVNIDLVGLRIVNAYDFLSASHYLDAFGNIHVTDTYGYCVRYCFNISNNPETSVITGFVADVNLFQGKANTGNKLLAKWTATHGAFMRIWGDGNGSTRSSKSQVQGILVNNTSVFGYRYGILVEGNATINESAFDALWDGVGTAFETKSGSCVANIRFTGTYFAYQWLAGGADNAPVFNLRPPAADCTAGIDISGQMAQAQGDFLVVAGSGWKAISISNLSGPGTYGRSTSMQPYHWVRTSDTPNLKISIIGNVIEPNKAGENYRGILMPSFFSAVILGNSFNGVFNAIDITENVRPVSIFGNISTLTSSETAVVGGVKNGLTKTNNAFDK